jgi:hypothetical protein
MVRFRKDVNHFTDLPGYNAIRAQPEWLFRAHDPPADHPRGAYFTTLGPETRNLSIRLRIPKVKLAFVFSFSDAGDLKRIDGDRGTWVFYSPADYRVVEDRQQTSGATRL